MNKIIKFTIRDLFDDWSNMLHWFFLLITVNIYISWCIIVDEWSFFVWLNMIIICLMLFVVIIKDFLNERF